MDDKVKLYIEISNILDVHLNAIFAQKEIIPWAASRSGKCFAVTTSVVGHNIEEVKQEIIRTLRSYEVTTSDVT